MKIQIMAFEILCVHWKLYAPTSVATGPGLSDAIDAVQTSFTINEKILFPTIVAAIELLTVWDLAQVLTIHS